MASVRASRHERHREAKIVTSNEHGEGTGNEMRDESASQKRYIRGIKYKNEVRAYVPTFHWMEFTME